MPKHTIAKAAGRQAFGADPAAYHRSRPGYPDWVFETLQARCGLRPGAALFEIGAGTGIATRRLLDLGADPVVAVEPDPRLAGFLRRNNPGAALRVVVSSFEDAALEASAFDLGVSATAFHWLDEDAALRKVARLLRPGGWWAAVWNVFGDDSLPDPFHLATEHLDFPLSSPSAGSGDIPFGLDREARFAAFTRIGAFEALDSLTSRWSLVLDADQTVALYATYSNISLHPERDSVLAEIGRIAREDFRGRVARNMTTSLYLARRKP